ncbi:MAG: ComEC/Rec2 family competence protein [Chloroflexi bacterium]|nr:ComEC/Rec2 family competence protein [Chloroflexota bacterium]
MRLIFLTLAWIGGILYAASGPIEAVPLWLGLATLSVAVAILLRRFSPLLITAAALGILRFELQGMSSPLATFNDTSVVTLEGVIGAEPDRRDTAIQIRLEVESLFQNGSIHPVAGNVLVSAPTTFVGEYGSRIRATGVLETPPESDRFSYADYLARAEIYSLMPRARITLLDVPARQDLRSALLSFRSRASRVIDDAIPDPSASLLAGILLGDERGLSPEVSDAFAETGAAHVIAISGFNMAILGGFMTRVLRQLKVRPVPAALISVAIIALYAAFVGGSPGVVRAALMTSLVFIASAVRRKPYLPTSLAFAVLLLSALDPLMLWDVGFQLSVFAVLGLAIFASPFAAAHDHLFSGLPTVLNPLSGLLRESITVSLAALVFTLPLSALTFGRLSPAVVLVNALIVPVQPAIMLFGGLGVVIGLLAHETGKVSLWLALLPLAWTTAIVRLFAQLPDVPVYPSPNAIASLFIGIMAIAVIRAARPEWSENVKNWSRSTMVVAAVLLASALLFVLALALWRSRPDGLMHLWFFDFGRSTVLMQTPQGQHVLIDGGNYPSRLLTAIGDRLPFYDRTIELQFISQPDDQFVSALPVFYDRYHADLVVINGALDDSDVLAQLGEQWDGSAQRPAVLNEVFQTGDGVSLVIRHSAQEAVNGATSDADRDDQALALQAHYGQFSFLYTGDLSASAQNALLTDGALSHVTLLHAPRGASSEALNEDLLARLMPNIAIVQTDSLRRGSEPSSATLTLLHQAQVFRTDLVGTVHIYTDGQEVWVESERVPAPSS